MRGDWKHEAEKYQDVDRAVLAKLEAEAVHAEMRRLLEKALTRSAVVHPGFADEIRAVLARAA